MRNLSPWRDALRAIARHRRPSLVVVATLAVLGAVAIAMASLAHNLLRSPWTYDTDRLGVVRHQAGAGAPLYGFAPDEFRTLAGSGLFDAITASRGGNVALGNGRDAARPVSISRTLPETLEVTDARPLLGRFVQPGERARERKVVISWPLWQREFDGAPDVLGRSVLLDGEAWEVVGVMPRRFHFQGADLWTAHDEDPRLDPANDPRLVLNVKLRTDLDPVALQHAIAELDARLPRRADATRYPPGWRVEVVRVIDAVIGPQRQAMLLLVAGAAALLLLGLANVATLMVSRQIADTALLTTRLALGEPRRRMLATVLIESLLLAAAALLLALALGQPLFQLLADMLAAEWVPRELEGDFRYANPSLWTLVPATLVIGLALTAIRLPALLRLDARSAAGGALRAGAQRGESRAAGWLAGAQVGIATAVALVALAITDGLELLDRRDIGFEPAAAMHARLVLPGHRYGTLEQRLAALDRLEPELRNRAGAVQVGWIDSAPLQRYARTGTVQRPQDGSSLPVDYRAVHGELAGALGMRLLEGRFVDARDRAESEAAVVVSRSLARELAPQGSALGLELPVHAGGGQRVLRRIVGVVDDLAQETPLSPARPTLYVPLAQEALPGSTNAGGTISVVLRHRGAAAPTVESVSAAVAAVDPWIALRDIDSFAARAQRSLAGLTMARELFGVFGLLGTAVALLGIAAAAMLAVSRRQRELALRLAIGAAPGNLLLHVLGGSLRTALIASLAGLGLGVALVHIVGASLQDVAVLPPGQALLVPLALALLAAGAAAWPALQAARIDPNVALRR